MYDASNLSLLLAIYANNGCVETTKYKQGDSMQIISPTTKIKSS